MPTARFQLEGVTERHGDAGSSQDALYDATAEGKCAYSAFPWACADMLDEGCIGMTGEYDAGQ